MVVVRYILFLFVRLLLVNATSVEICVYKEADRLSTRCLELCRCSSRVEFKDFVQNTHTQCTPKSASIEKRGNIGK